MKIIAGAGLMGIALPTGGLSMVAAMLFAAAGMMLLALSVPDRRRPATAAQVRRLAAHAR